MRISLNEVIAGSLIITILCIVLFDPHSHAHVRSICYLWTMLAIMALTIFSLIIRKHPLKPTLFDGLVILFFVYLTLNYLFVSQVNVSTRYFNTIYLILLYFALRLLLTSYPNIIKVLLVVFILFGLGESLLGFAQSLGLTDSGHTFPVTGTLSNPGPYGGFLAIVIALGASCIVKHYRILRRNTRSISLFVLYILSLFAAFTVLIMIMNRAALIAAIASTVICLFNSKAFRNKLKHYTAHHRIKTAILSSAILLVTIFSEVSRF